MAVAAHIEPARLAATRPMLSVVLPAHDEAGVIEDTLARIAALDSDLTDRIEVIVVSDGSTDTTFEEACEGLLRGLEGRVVELATNVGAHAAIRCGLRYARGDLVALMAADGQDPPEALPAMLERFSPELDVVWGWRRDRRSDGRARLPAAAFYRCFRLLTGLDYPPSGLDFLVVRRRVVDAVLQHSTRNTSLHLLIYNLGFAQAFLEYDRGPRVGGHSSWTLRKRLKLAVDMLTGCSAAPIRITSLVGILAGLVGIALGGVTLVRAALGAVPASGWASLMVVSSFMGGLMLVAIAFLGEYVWRILDEVRGAPPFIEARHERAGRAPDGPAVTGTPETTLERTPSTGPQINSGEPAPVGPLRGHDGPRTSGEAKASESVGGKALPKQIDHEVVQRS
jgi:glycosyltransferase involved in cell wall biosynthesis